MACVRDFYKRGLADPMLGPVMSGSIHDLDSHVATVANFWSKSLLHTERYDGHPYTAHTHLPVEPEHFARWLELFTQAVRDNLPANPGRAGARQGGAYGAMLPGGMVPVSRSGRTPEPQSSDAPLPVAH